jgi:hypothetical protein
MHNYHPPEYKKPQFHCIHCGVFSLHAWRNFYCWNKSHAGYSIHKPLESCVCEHCKKWSYWYDERMIFPAVALVPAAHMDMPQECITDYEEARGIVDASPRAASALLRLVLQKLMISLGENGKNIDVDIANLVEKGLPVEVRQAIDACRINGDKAMHPGKIETSDIPEDTSEVAYRLFNIINFIVEDRISRPTRIESLFAQFPESVKKTIERYDGFET